jgi:hypothetical protein
LALPSALSKGRRWLGKCFTIATFSDDCFSRKQDERGVAIEVAGKAAQSHAIASYNHARAAEATGSRQELAQAAFEHAKENNEKIKATEIDGEVVKSRSSNQQKR